MSRFPVVLLLVLFLCGCTNGDSDFNRAMKLRDTVLKCSSCSLTADITADYGDATHKFKMTCNVDSNGNIVFEVIEPDTISGITGKISDDTGMLTFDEQALMFEMLADGQITPISAPWLMLRTLRSGYISACGQDEQKLRIQIDDSYYGDSLHADIWIDENNAPVRAEFVWKGKRIVSIDVADFLIV